MTKEEFIFGNKIIAEYMGGIIVEPKVDSEGNCLFDMSKTRVQNEQFWNSKSLKYHSSWDWLVPVIKKCIQDNIWESKFTNWIHDSLLDLNIEDCWETCIEFIYEIKRTKK